jgi:hypothetical protein
MRPAGEDSGEEAMQYDAVRSSLVVGLRVDIVVKLRG